MKPEAEFTRDLGRSGKGRTRYRCRDCEIQRVRVWRDKNRLWFNAYCRERHREKSEHRPAVARAHRLVAQAIKAGTLAVKDTCQACGKVGKLNAHHADYSKPLGVIWLCPKCHKAIHTKT